VQKIENELFEWLTQIAKTRLWYKFAALKNGIFNNKNSQENLFNLRRNIHRLEKGLSYEEIKPIFAEDYIFETVSILQKLYLSGNLENNTITWAKSVLDLYFKISKPSPEINKAYSLYSKLIFKNIENNWFPYTSDLRPKISVNYEDFYNLALRRRSVRFFLDRLVETDLIFKAMDIAALSPSACNRQSFKFLFFNEKSLVKKISEIPGGIRGYEVPNIIIVIGSYEGYFDERDINAPVIDSSLAVMSFLFALETLGLSSVCINWPNITDKEKKIREIINIKNHEFIIMLIGIGYAAPEGKIPYSAKRETHNLLEINPKIKNT
jgi:nitroreductase